MFKVTAWEPKTLRWWHSQRNKIDMDPPYQRRGKLWTSIDKAFLIDSILNDLDIPKFYVADFTFGNTVLNQKNLPYAIIDGKQRFEAVLDFFDHKLLLSKTFLYYEDQSLDLTGLSYGDLKQNHSDIADKFDNYSLSVMRVIADDEAKINELFVRLNRSKPLTGAEIRNAMAGTVPRLVRSLASRPFFTTNARFKMKRGGDQNTAAKMLLFEFRGGLVDTKRVHLDRFVQEGLEAQSGDMQRAVERTTQVLIKMEAVFTPSDPLLAFAGIIPVYYWFIRSLGKAPLLDVRPFLVQFDRERRQFKTRNKELQSGSDPEILAFEQFNRSTNDQASHEGRFKILLRRYEQYSKDRRQDKLI